MGLQELLPADWREVLKAEFTKPYFPKLEAYVAQQRATATVFPPEAEVFSAFHYTPFEDVKVLILGQDPYHGPGQAHGLSFSVKPGVAIPPSLRNMYKELQDDLGCAVPKHGSLEHWAKQGVMMLNAVLTVRQAEPNAHKDQGWEQFTDAVIQKLNEREHRLVFVLWGGYAKKKSKLIKNKAHAIIEGAHPSPLSVQLFMGSKPYSKVNAALAEVGKPPIDWAIPPL
jgi:uracil-DNA glycosylase